MSSINLIIRRSHTKSKNGCRPCRERRIKCDEMQPCCRKCLQTKRTCHYVSGGLSRRTNENDQRQVNNFLWPPEVEQSCQMWRDSGVPPFQHLNIPISPSWNDLSLKDLKYLHHLSNLASILELGKVRQCCLWWGQFSTFVQLSLRFGFVAQAVLGQSAGHLAMVTKSSAVFEDASRYRYLAVQGLNRAIQSFSQSNSDAILLCSIAISNQEHDWRAWKAIMEGISAVICQIQPWIESSLLHSFLMQSSPRGGYISILNKSTDLGSDACQDKDMNVAARLLTEGIESLNRLTSCSKNGPDLAVLVRQLRDTLRIVQTQPVSQWSKEDQFKLIHPFTAWMNRYSISFFTISQADSVVLATLAHFFAIPVALELIFSSIDLPLIAPIRLQGIIEIDRILKERTENYCQKCRVFHSYTELIAFPINTVHVYTQLS